MGKEDRNRCRNGGIQWGISNEKNVQHCQAKSYKLAIEFLLLS